MKCAEEESGVKICTVEGCERPSRRRNWCAMHYDRWWRTGSHELRSSRFRDPNIKMPTDGTTEEWRPIDGYEGYYEASNLGQVRSVTRVITRSDGRPKTIHGRLLKPHVHNNRRFVSLARGGTHRPYPIAALVLMAFVGPRPDKQHGCHNDGNSMNDALTNLRWDTARENILDEVRHGTHNNAAKTHCPWGHRLAQPNLIAAMAKLGGRSCRACNTARSAKRQAEKRGSLYDYQYESDLVYARILQREAS